MAAKEEIGSKEILWSLLFFVGFQQLHLDETHPAQGEIMMQERKKKTVTSGVLVDRIKGFKSNCKRVAMDYGLWING